MPSYGYVILITGWIAWAAPFAYAKRAAEPAKVIDRRARWGIVLVATGYMLLWQGRFWERPLPAWRLALTIVFLVFDARCRKQRKRRYGDAGSEKHAKHGRVDGGRTTR